MKYMRAEHGPFAKPGTPGKGEKERGYIQTTGTIAGAFIGFLVDTSSPVGTAVGAATGNVVGYAAKQIVFAALSGWVNK